VICLLGMSHCLHRCLARFGDYVQLEDKVVVSSGKIRGGAEALVGTRGGRNVFETLLTKKRTISIYEYTHVD